MAGMKEIEANADQLFRQDGRTVLVRELRQREAVLTADLGGRENLSYQQKSLCRRAVYLEGLCESLEAKIVKGQAIDISEYTLLTNALRILYMTLGLHRKAKELDLHGYLKEKYETSD